MHEAVFRAEEVHERAELHDLHDLAFVDRADFRLSGQADDPFLRSVEAFFFDSRDLHRAVVLDIDLRARLFDDLADDLAARADDVTDLVDRDLHRDHLRSIFRNLVTCARHRLVHLVEDVQAAAVRLGEGSLHDVERDRVDLQVHLQRGDAHFGAGNLEVHVAKVIIITQDVGQDGDAIGFLDEAHGDARHRTGDRNACVHHGQRRAADRSHR